MKIVEYRMVLPFTADEFQVGRKYFLNLADIAGKRTQGDFDTTELVPKEEWKHGVWGTGTFTKSMMHLQHLIPGWVWKMFSKEYAEVVDEEWYAHPFSKRKFSVPHLGEKLKVDCELLQLPYQAPAPEGVDLENVFGLDAAELKKRTVETIDLFEKVDYKAWKVADPRAHPYAPRAPEGLPEDWLTNPNVPKIMSYKLARVEVKIWGIQTMSEKEILRLGMRQPTLKGALNMWNLIPEWGELSIEDVDRLIEEGRAKGNRAAAGDAADTVGADGEPAPVSPDAAAAPAEADASVKEAADKMEELKVDDAADAAPKTT